MYLYSNAYLCIHVTVYDVIYLKNIILFKLWLFSLLLIQAAEAEMGTSSVATSNIMF